MYGCLLSPIILKLLPEDILLEWNRRPVAKAFNLDDLLKFLQQEVEGRERSAIVKSSVKAGKDTTMTRKAGSEEEKKVKAITPTAKALYVHTSEAETKDNRKRPADTTCAFCNKNDHRTWEYKASMNYEQRTEIVKKGGRCFQCLRLGHPVVRCYRKKCELCQRKHHRLLCRQEGEREGQWTVQKPTHDIQATQSVMLLKTATVSPVFMKLAHTWGEGKDCRTQVRCLFDDGSQRSFIREDVANLLKLPIIRSERLMVKGFSNLGKIWRVFSVVTITLRSLIDEAKEASLELLVIPEIVSVSPQVHSEQIAKKLESAGLQMAWIPGNHVRQDTVDILVGLDHYWKLMSGANYPLSAELMASESLFGWLVNGTMETTLNENSCAPIVMFTGVDELFEEDLVTKAWDVENIGIIEDNDSGLSIRESQILEEFEDSICYENGRYQVRMPWKPNVSRLKSNRSLALTRLYSLLRRFGKKPDLFERYKQAILKYAEDGHAEIVDPYEKSTNTLYYIPHQAIIKEDRLTTKVRIVFDASSHEAECASLNECLECGPNLNPDIVSLLVRFRKDQVAIMADIEKAFLQVAIAKSDQDATRFLWVEEGWSPGKKPKITEYRMLRVLFGARCSPFLLAATIRYHLKVMKDQFPETCKELDRSYYVDDLISSKPSVSKAYILCNEARVLMQNAGMPLKRWASNSEELLQQLKYSWKESDTLMIQDYGSLQKVLGLVWDTGSDCLALQMKSILQVLTEPCKSKRSLLQCSGRIFDPLGFVSPLTAKLRCLFQKTWGQKIPWDAELPPEIQKPFKTCIKEIQELGSLKLPRCYGDFSQAKSLQLHVFCDASEKAYGSVCYLRAKLSNKEIYSTFVISRGRVAPIKKLTLPRLELLACLIGARLAKHLQSALLKTNLETVMWTDSLIAVQWISSENKKWNTFVANRVAEIHSLVGRTCWNHCPSSENPADLITRGKPFKDLVFWWEGPLWVKQPEEQWPAQQFQQPTDNGEESKKITVGLVVPAKKLPLLQLEKYSSLWKLLRITAWVFRFVSRALKRGEFEDGLSVEEIDKAKEYWLKYAQEECFAEEINMLRNGLQCLPVNSKLKDLNP